ncbi:MAG: hypothetical protein AAGU14_04320 [Eubacteriaceae bacterium]
MMHRFYIGGDMMGLGMIGHVFGFLVMAFVVTAVIILLVKSSKKQSQDMKPVKPVEEVKANNDEAMQIAKLRLAKGEITAEEYAKIKETLELK